MQVIRTHITHDAFQSPLGHSLIKVFHQAFNSSPHWDEADWPIGSPEEPGTVAHTVATFARRKYCGSVIHSGTRVLSFVIWGLLTEDCCREYRLTEFGGRAGEGFIPFIGVDPEFRSYRVHSAGQELSLKPRTLEGNGDTQSLIGGVFDDALKHLDARCRCSWSRTRSVLKPVQAIFSSSGFVEVGRFDYLHQGKVPQDRIVYRRMQG